jgi:hypothetical protein
VLDALSLVLLAIGPDCHMGLTNAHRRKALKSGFVVEWDLDATGPSAFCRI